MEEREYPTQDQVLAVTDPRGWIDAWFLRGDPWAFVSEEVDFVDISCEAAQKLGVDRNGVFCIGSGAIGLSLNPGKMVGGNLKQFNSESDIDMAIVSRSHFDIAWQDLLVATQPHLREVSPTVTQHLAWQKKRLFDGAILTNKLLGEFSFGIDWLQGIEQLSQLIVSRLDRNVKVEFWVYRDYWSLRNYVAKGLVGCQRERAVGGEL